MKLTPSILGPWWGWLLLGCAQLQPSLPQAPSFFHRVWSKNLDPPQQTGNLPISTTAATIHQGFVFQGLLSGGFAAYALEDGRTLWQVQEPEAITSSAAIFGPHVLYGDQAGRIYARHFLTGRLQYSFDVDSAVEGKMSFFQGRGFAHTRNHSLVAFDAKTGKILWSFKRNIAYTTTVQGASSAIIYHNYLIVGFADGYLAALSYENGLLVWEQKIASAFKFVDIDVTAKLHQKALYVCTHGGPFTKLNPLTGEVIQRFDFQASAAPLFIQGKIFVGGEDGSLHVLTERGRFLNTLALTKNAPVTGILWWKDHLVISNIRGELYQIDPVQLTVRSRHHLGHEHSALYLPPSLQEGYLAVMSARNRLYVFK